MEVDGGYRVISGDSTDECEENEFYQSYISAGILLGKREDI